MLNDIGDKQMI